MSSTFRRFLSLFLVSILFVSLFDATEAEAARRRPNRLRRGNAGRIVRAKAPQRRGGQGRQVRRGPGKGRGQVQARGQGQRGGNNLANLAQFEDIGPSATLPSDNLDPFGSFGQSRFVGGGGGGASVFEPAPARVSALRGSGDGSLSLIDPRLSNLARNGRGEVFEINPEFVKDGVIVDANQARGQRILSLNGLPGLPESGRAAFVGTDEQIQLLRSGGFAVGRSSSRSR